MNVSLTDSIQNYIKVIYTLNAEGKEASTTTLAARLGVAPASVTGMLQKLASFNPPLIVYHKHRGAHLTPEGERAALEVLRHHRLLETYLVEQLGYSWDSVHEEACKLEHVISEEFETRIAEALGHPERSPHGAPIPSADLVMPSLGDLPLSSLSVGEEARLSQLRCEDAASLHQMNTLGLRPGVHLKVVGYSPASGEWKIEVEGRPPIIIGRALGEQIFVERFPVKEET